MRNNIDNIADEVHSNSKNLVRMAKDRMFDLIAIGLVSCVALLNLGAIGLRNITVLEIFNILLEAVPFYLASVTLALTFYKKGVYNGKTVDVFIDIVKNYSHRVNKLTGKQLDILCDFCVEYNEKALRIGQSNILRTVAIKYDRYINPQITKDGKEIKPLCQMSKEELEKNYGERVAEYVLKANKLKVKGLNANNLLGNDDYWDITDLGKNEQELLKQHAKSYAMSFAASTLLLTVMTIKDIMSWGWVGFVLIAFKLLFIFCRCYFEFFKGYEDITIKVVNHISRKTDVLKQYDYWYYEKYPNEFDLNDPDYAYLGNISVEKSYNIIDNGSKTGDDGTSPKNVIGEQNVCNE